MDWPLACGPGALLGPGQHAGQHCSARRRPEGPPGQPQGGSGATAAAECWALQPPVHSYIYHLGCSYHRCQYGMHWGHFLMPHTRFHTSYPKPRVGLHVMACTGCPPAHGHPAAALLRQHPPRQRQYQLSQPPEPQPAGHMHPQLSGSFGSLYRQLECQLTSTWGHQRQI